MEGSAVDQETCCLIVLRFFRETVALLFSATRLIESTSRLDLLRLIAILAFGEVMSVDIYPTTKSEMTEDMMLYRLLM